MWESTAEDILKDISELTLGQRFLNKPEKHWNMKTDECEYINIVVFLFIKGTKPEHEKFASFYVLKLPSSTLAKDRQNFKEFH